MSENKKFFEIISKNFAGEKSSYDEDPSSEYEIHTAFEASYTSYGYTYRNTQNFDPEVDYKKIYDTLRLRLESLMEAAEVTEDNYIIQSCNSILLGLSREVVKSGL